MNISDTCLKAINEHMLTCFPNEGCGVVVAGEFIPLKNKSKNPTGECEVDASVFVQYDVQAFIHSHTKSDNRPSLLDTIAWRRHAVVFGILSCDGERVSSIRWMDENNPEPLIGRHFIYGYHDCGSLVRDWFWMERGIRIPDFDRDPEWKPGLPHKDLYTDIIKPAGFAEVPLKDLKAGDVLLMSLAGPHAHHAAVYLGDGKILHQLNAPSGRHLSGVHDLHGVWDRAVRKVVRYQQEQQEGDQ